MKLYRRLMEAFAKSIPSGDQREILKGVHYKKSGDTVKLEATDGRVLVSAEVPAEEGDIDADAVMSSALWEEATSLAPIKSLRKVKDSRGKKALSPVEGLLLTLDEKEAHAGREKKKLAHMFAMPLIIGQYPNTGSVVPNYTKILPVSEDKAEAVCITVNFTLLARAAEAIGLLLQDQPDRGSFAMHHGAVDMLIPTNLNQPIIFKPHKGYADHVAINHPKIMALCMPIKTPRMEDED